MNNDIPESVMNVYQVFQDFYGEERTDLQKITATTNLKIDYYRSCIGYYAILVYWDEVTITNEYDESIDIWGLYCATLIDSDGKLYYGPSFMRSIYDLVQWNQKYCHSHRMSLSYERVSYFIASCLGSGPLRNTTNELRDICDLDIWRLYCWELDKYVHVESLSGGPHRRLNQISTSRGGYLKQFNVRTNFPLPSSHVCKYLTKKLIHILFTQDVLKFNYVDGKYFIGMPYIECVLAISNAFIEYYNSDSSLRHTYPVEVITRHNFIEDAVIHNGNLMKEGTGDGGSIVMPVGTVLLSFKGKDVVLTQKHSTAEYSQNKVHIINTDILDNIIYNILKYLNFNYGKSTSATGKETRYL